MVELKTLHFIIFNSILQYIYIYITYDVNISVTKFRLRMVKDQNTRTVQCFKETSKSKREHFVYGRSILIVFLFYIIYINLTYVTNSLTLALFNIEQISE